MQINHFSWCLPLAVVLLVIPLVLTIRWFRQDKHSGFRLLAITLLVIASVTVLRMPLHLDWGETMGASLLHGAIDAMQTIGLDADLNEAIEKGVGIIDGKEMTSFADIGGMSRFYASFAIVQYALGLLLCGFAVVKTISSGLQRWWLRNFRLRPVFFFSHMTEESILLARSIQDEAAGRKRNTLVCFASAGEEMPSHLAHAWQAAGLKNVVCIPESLNTKMFPRLARGVNCVLCAPEENDNLQLLHELLEDENKVKSSRRRSMKYYVVARTRNAERTVDALMTRYIRTQKGDSIIFMINPAENLAVDILSKAPLYKYAGEKLNILIGGSTPVAEHFLRNAYACGQMAGCELSITLAAPDARRLEEELYSAAPMLKQKDSPVVQQCGQISFVPLETCAGVADEALVQNADYVLLAFDSDTENIQAARRIRRIIEGKKLVDAVRRRRQTAIVYVVENPALNQISAEVDPYADDGLYTPCDMIPTGSRKEQYAVDMFFYHDLLCKGFFLDQAYVNSFPQAETKEQIHALQKKFAWFQSGMRDGERVDNSDRRASVSAALHLEYRRHAGPMDREVEAATEHRRWNAYMIMAGQMAPTPEQLDAYFYTAGHNHKHMHLHLHPAMVTSDASRPENLWAGEENIDDFDRFSLYSHNRLLAMLRDMLEKNGIPAQHLTTREEFAQAVASMTDDAQKQAARKLAAGLYRDFKDFDRQMAGQTENILALAADEKVSAALRLFWLEVKP